MTDSNIDVQAAVRQRFGKIATSPACETKFPIGPANAKALGYDSVEIDRLPKSATESFVGVTNVLQLGEIRSGDTVVDLGCGAGLDCLLAAGRIGPTGKAIGVDMTEAMIDKAQRNAAELGIENVEFFHGCIENLPLPDEVADVVISNGAFNLCPDKPRSLAETYRILRPGGRLQMADVFLDEHFKPEDRVQVGDWCE